jgi:hypothetical protein
MSIVLNKVILATETGPGGGLIVRFTLTER